MGGELRHRGPDGTGVYVDGSFGMVSTRLAIIDLAGGDQPLSDERRRYWVMQNGEIYNYLELQQELTSLGHVLATASDTEVIAHAYEEWGPGCLDRLNGEFAFAVWDRLTRELFLARDRFGIRPLFLTNAGGDLSFASETKALFRHPRVVRQLDPLGLAEAFATWSIAPDRSAFTGVRELAPGHLLRWGPEGLREERRWWDLDFSPGRYSERPSLSDAAEELSELLEDATRIRLRADVPVAAYQSGGLDSSVIAALARRVSPAELSSFGVGFEDELFDESRFQDLVTESLGTKLTRVRVGARAIAEAMPRVVELAEKPTLRTAPAPLFSLSEAVRDSGLKVVLTGEGADELFGGYDIFRECKIRRFWARDPAATWRGTLLTRVNAFLARDLARTGGFLTLFYGRGLTDTSDPLYSHRIRFANASRLAQLFSPELTTEAAKAGDPLERLSARLPEAFSRFTPLGQAQYLEITTFLESYLLHTQGDRMLMGHSIEGRFPFLDYRVAELAARLPDEYRLLGLREKVILRRVATPLVPPEIVSRTKQPYRAPIAPALVGPDAPTAVREALAPEHVARAGLFRPDAVAAVVRKCEAAGAVGVGETDEMALVGVVSTMLLHDRFVARPVLAPPVSPTRLVIGDLVVPPGDLTLREALESAA
jgi:asparagine synthase (glutamine-hydrolysing)